MTNTVHYRDSDVLINLHARLGEGPRWDHRVGLLAWVDILGGHVHLTEVDTGVTTSIPVGPDVGALALHGDDGYLLAIRNSFATLDGAKVEVIHELFGDADVRMNDGVVDPVGRFVAGSMAHGAAPGRGSLYARDLDGSVRTLIDGVTISNGLAWSAAGDQMYYADSGLGGIDVMDYDLESGAIARRRRWVDVHADDGVPDGIAIDAEGCLWVALWGGYKVRRYSPAGQIIGEVELPVPQVSACGFGGPNLDKLFITTAAVGRGEDKATGSLDGALFVVDPGCRGVASVVVGGTS